MAETPIEWWDELHATTVRASAFLISKLLPAMIRNDFGVICNTIAAEGLPFGGHFSAAMVGQRSMILSLAAEINRGKSGSPGISVLAFAPGVVDTPLVSGLAPYAMDLRGITHEEYIANFIDNPGYDDLMPAEDCGASYVYCLAHARDYHGQVADAFHPLISHGIITPKAPEDEELARDGEGLDPSMWAVSDYVKGVSSVNRNLEVRIEERTRDLEAANQQLATQNRLIEDLSSKLSRHLPQQVYQSIFSGEIGAELHSQRKNLTVFFSDIRDFTRKTEQLEPEALSAVLNSYFSAMTDIARTYGATIDKFIGDAILAFFGDPESLGAAEDAKQCIDMAIEMQCRMNSLQADFVRLGLQEPLEIRIGINSGYCTVGNFGSYDRLDYTIIGTPVNIAARLQEFSEPNAILVSKNTQVLVAKRFQFEPCGYLELKGIADEVEAFTVLFDVEETAKSGDSVASITQKLAEIDIERLGDAERKELLNAMSKLLKQ